MSYNFPAQFKRFGVVYSGMIPVVRYRRPEKSGSIIIPDSYVDKDTTMTLWEYEEGWPLGQGSKDHKILPALEVLGIRNLGTSIIKTRSTWPIATPYIAEDGRDIFFLDPDKVEGIIPLDESFKI